MKMKDFTECFFNIRKSEEEKTTEKIKVLESESVYFIVDPRLRRSHVTAGEKKKQISVRECPAL